MSQLYTITNPNNRECSSDIPLPKASKRLAGCVAKNSNWDGHAYICQKQPGGKYEWVDVIAAASTDETLVCGCQVQHDDSGQGHNWRNISASDLPPNVIMEIECEIIDGHVQECDDYRATNGLHYRW
jgi:hypothetical protein